MPMIKIVLNNNLKYKNFIGLQSLKQTSRKFSVLVSKTSSQTIREITANVKSNTEPVIMEGQKQTNYDYILTIAQKMGHAMGLNRQTVTRFHDCKDGGGILRHSTRGSLGIITFDKDGKHIQTTPYPIIEEHLEIFNKKRLSGLETYLREIGLFEGHFQKQIELCDKELKSGKSIFDINLNIENILWNNIQRDPLFPRSISFVFLQKTHFDPIPSHFEKCLMDSLNPNRGPLNPYNLDKRGDAKEFYSTCLKVYQKPINSPDVDGINVDIKKTTVLNNDPEMKDNIHVNASRECTQQLSTGSDHYENIN